MLKSRIEKLERRCQPPVNQLVLIAWGKTEDQQRAMFFERLAERGITEEQFDLQGGILVTVDLVSNE